MAVAIALAAAIAACSSASSLLEKVTGDDDEVKLTGKREAVLRSSELSASDAVADDPIAVPAAVRNANWSQPGGTPSNALHNLELPRQLNRAFKVDAGAGSDSDGRLTAPPIVTGGRVYVLDSQASVRAFSASDGKHVWSRSLVPKGKDAEGAFGGGLASDGTRIYATTAFGEVVALSASTGQEVWRRQLDAPIRAAPTVAGGRLFFSTVNNEVHALSSSDGSSAWRYQGTGEQASILASNSPAVAQGYVVVPYTTGDILTFRADSGIFQWTDSLGGGRAFSSLATLNSVAGRPVVTDGTVYALAHSGRMAAFELESGSELWSQKLPGTQTPWVAGDYAFVIVERNKIAAVARRNGAVRWWAQLPGEGVWSGPVMAGGRLLAVSSKGMLVEMSPQTGQVMRKSDLGPAFYIAPVVANNTIYLLGDDASLIAMR